MNQILSIVFATALLVGVFGITSIVFANAPLTGFILLVAIGCLGLFLSWSQKP